MKKAIFSLILIISYLGCTNEKREILQDAIGNSSAQCDSTILARTISYSQDVVPILQQNCLSCHSGSAPQGGILLDSYQNVKNIASTGQLLGAIQHAPGYRPMPPSGKLPDSSICIIETWINQGMQNN